MHMARQHAEHKSGAEKCTGRAVLEKTAVPALPAVQCASADIDMACKVEG